jgi:hypothetical protein
MLDLSLNIECPQCRGAEFIRAANPSSDDTVTCSACASEFRYGALEDRAVQAAQALLAQAFPKMQFD